MIKENSIALKDNSRGRGVRKECSVAAKEDKEDPEGDPRVILFLPDANPFLALLDRGSVSEEKKRANQKRRHRKMKGT